MTTESRTYFTARDPYGGLIFAGFTDDDLQRFPKLATDEDYRQGFIDGAQSEAGREPWRAPGESHGS